VALCGIHISSSMLTGRPPSARSTLFEAVERGADDNERPEIRNELN